MRKVTVSALFAMMMGGSIQAVHAAEYTEYCAGIVFRETPFADIRCARALSRDAVGETKHFELDYDADGRLLEVRHSQTGELRAFSDRFVRAPRVTIQYQNDQEIRQFYNEWGHRTLVSGDVYEARFDLDEKGRRTGLVFYGLDGKPLDNDFGISRYEWGVREDGEVIERRYNTAGELVRNRPGFGYMVTRFAYDARGLLTRMYNLGESGETLTADEAGIAMTEISYNRHGQFSGWLNLDMEGKARRGMSDIAEIVYEPSQYSSEQVAIFNDADGSPQTTGWGAHKVVYEFDHYGNATARFLYGVDGMPVNTNTGVGQIKSTWSERGAYLLKDQYFDKDGNPAASGYSGVHSIVTSLGSNGRPQTITYQDLNGNPTVHKGEGYATEQFEFDGEGRLISRRFMDTNGSLVDHGTWGVARFEYEHAADGGLVSVRSYTAAGEEKLAAWNPAH
ncbi:hypothetical protein [Kordiimonas sp.]|uniref:hypothetical protein n=1 Tax=Kordiimonas sp. TaxID=1970157 RepID=UPI003A93A367